MQAFGGIFLRTEDFILSPEIFIFSSQNFIFSPQNIFLSPEDFSLSGGGFKRNPLPLYFNTIYEAVGKSQYHEGCH